MKARERMYWVLTTLQSYGPMTVRDLTWKVIMLRSLENSEDLDFDLELNRNKRIISHYNHEYRYTVLEKKDGKGLVRLRRTDRVKRKLQRLLRDKDCADNYGWAYARKRSV
jgi:hypothetical protein